MAQTKSAVVAGGTGGIGEGIVRSLLAAGWTVHVPMRGQDRADKLRAYVADVGADRLHLSEVDLAEGDQVAQFQKQVSARGPLGLVVVGVGSSYYGPSLHQVPRGDWDRLIQENLLTHFHLQKEFLSLLHRQNQGVYVTLTGPEADFAHPETGLMSILAAAQKMMARVEALEAAGSAVKVYSVTSKTPVATRARGAQSGADWITPEELGQYVVSLAEQKAAGLGDPLHVIESRDQLKKILKKA